MNSRKIVFFHALNDNSGSPHILSLIIRGLLERGFTADLFTSSVNGGFLSGIKGVRYHKIFYRFSGNKILTSFLFISVQIRYFFATLKYIGNKNVIFYINTIIPFGATLGAYVIRKKSVCHVHENPVKKNVIHRIALLVLLKLSSKAVFVSKYLYDSYIMDEAKKVLVFNALSPGFVEIAEKHIPMFKNPGNILMACSLKIYKGIFVFLELAELFPEFTFTLILNAGIDDITAFFRKKKIPGNLDIIHSQDNLIPFYEKTQLVVNLSLPDLCIEAFGLTILEALTFGIPVIVPQAGGIGELVTDGINGYKINAGDTKNLAEKIIKIFSDEEHYYKMSADAKLSSKKFNYKTMIDSIERVLI